MLDKFSSAPWTTTDVVAFTAVIVAALGSLFTLAVSIASLAVSLKSLKETRTLELAKLSSILWEKQAAFVQDCFPKIREFFDSLAETGVGPNEQTIQKVNAVRSSILAHAPFIPRATEDGLLEVVGKFRKILARSTTGEALGPELAEIRGKVFAEAAEFLIDLMEPKSIIAVTDRLRDLLHTNELSQARARALGIAKESER